MMSTRFRLYAQWCIAGSRLSKASLPRSNSSIFHATWSCLILRILNDLNLPHLQMIAEAFLQPARRNGELLLLRILGDAGVYTFSEAIFGFSFWAACWDLYWGRYSPIHD